MSDGNGNGNGDFLFNIDDDFKFDDDEDDDGLGGIASGAARIGDDDDEGGYNFGGVDDDDNLFNLPQDTVTAEATAQQQQHNAVSQPQPQQGLIEEPTSVGSDTKRAVPTKESKAHPPKKPKLTTSPQPQPKAKRTINTLIDDIQAFAYDGMPKTQMQDPWASQSNRRITGTSQPPSQQATMAAEKMGGNYGGDEENLSNTKTAADENEEESNGGTLKQFEEEVVEEEEVEMEEEEGRGGVRGEGGQLGLQRQQLKQQEQQQQEEALVTQRIPVSEQMIPGPAGGLSAKKDEMSDSSMEGIEDVMRAGLPYSGEREGSKKAFLSQAWVRMLYDNKMYPFGGEKASTNVRYVIKYGFLEKVPKICVVINEVVPLDTVNVKLKLMDPSGKISGMAPKKALDQFPEMKTGAVMSLRKVSVFNSSRTSHHLNIVPENIHKIYTNESRDAEATGESSDDYVKALFLSKIDNDISLYLKNLCANLYDIKVAKKSSSTNQLQDPARALRTSSGSSGLSAATGTPFGSRKARPFVGPAPGTPQLKRSLSGSHKSGSSPSNNHHQQQQQPQKQPPTATTAAAGTPIHKKTSPVVVIPGARRSPAQTAAAAVAATTTPSKVQQKSALPATPQSYFQPSTPLAQKKTQQRVIVASQKSPTVVVGTVGASQRQQPQVVQQKKVVVVVAAPTSSQQVLPSQQQSQQQPVVVSTGNRGLQQSQGRPQQKAVVIGSQKPVIVMNANKKQPQPQLSQPSQPSQQQQIQQKSQHVVIVPLQKKQTLPLPKQQQQRQQKQPIIIVGKKTSAPSAGRTQSGSDGTTSSGKSEENGIINLIDGNSSNDGYDDFNFDFGDDDDDDDIISKFLQQ